MMNPFHVHIKQASKQARREKRTARQAEESTDGATDPRQHDMGMSVSVPSVAKAYDATAKAKVGRALRVSVQEVDERALL